MGSQSDMGGASTPQGTSPSFGPNMFGAQKPPPGQPAPLVPGTPGRQSDPLPTSDPVQPNNPHVQPMLPPAYSDPVMPGLAKAFMGNQATQAATLPQIIQSNQPTQGATLPQIMQPPQSAMPDIAAMLAARKPAVQPIAPAPVAPGGPQTAKDRFLKLALSPRERQRQLRANAGNR